MSTTSKSPPPSAEATGASAAAIRSHYDVGNDFYRLWLGPTMTYSAALFEPGEGLEDLDNAQIRKLDHHVEQSHARGARRVLDVGCGWGSVLAHLVEKCDVAEATGLTLSETQESWVARRALPGVSVRRESWADHQPVAPYDAIISIGAFEHFARPGVAHREKIAGYRRFFDRCREWLQPAGHLSLQTIAYGNMSEEDASDFINSEIFPESDLPRLADIAEASDGLFEVVTLRNDPDHYALTCRAWLHRLKEGRDAAIRSAGEDVFRRYVQYLKLSYVGFRQGKLGLLRIGLKRIDRPRPDASQAGGR